MPQNLLIIWSPQWELGIEILDEQHRGAATLINTLFYYINQQQRTDIILPLMLAVQKYADLHTLTEEDLLIQSGYPKTKEHIDLHREVALELQQKMRETIKTGDYIAAPDIFLTFLKKWWLGHLCGADREFVPHLLTYLGKQEKKLVLHK